MFTASTPYLDDSTGTWLVDWTGLRGDTLYFSVAKKPLSGWDTRVWTSQVRVNATDDDPAATFAVTDNSTANEVSVFFKLATDDLIGTYKYDVQWNDPDNDITTTIITGKIKIKSDVTRG